MTERRSCIELAAAYVSASDDNAREAIVAEIADHAEISPKKHWRDLLAWIADGDLELITARAQGAKVAGELRARRREAAKKPASPSAKRPAAKKAAPKAKPAAKRPAAKPAAKRPASKAVAVGQAASQAEFEAFASASPEHRAAAMMFLSALQSA